MLYQNKDYLVESFIVQGKTARQISEELGVSKSTIEQWLQRFNLYGIKPRTKYTLNRERITPCPEMYYYIGLITTDGYIDNRNNRVSIRMRNEGTEELLNNLKDYFEFNGSVRLYKEKDYDLTMTSKDLINFMASLGIYGTKKTYTVTVPNTFPNRECVLLYLRGILDGDGNIHLFKDKDGNLKGGNFRLVTGSLELMKGIKKLLNDYLDIDTPIKEHHIKDKKYPMIDLGMSDSRKFYREIYKGYEKFRLSSKFLKAKQVVNDIV